MKKIILTILLLSSISLFAQNVVSKEDLDKQVSVLKTNINSIQSENNKLKTEISSINSKVSTVNQKLKTLELKRNQKKMN